MKAGLRAIWRSGPGRIGLVLVALLVVMAAVSYVWQPFPPLKVVPSDEWKGISGDHWFGTDGGGKDLFSQVLVGSRVSLFVAFATSLCAAVIGIGLGVLSAMAPRWIGESLAQIVDVVIAIPTLVLAIVLIGVFSPGLIVVVLALGLGFGVALARVVKGEAARVLTQDYILAAHASGTSTWRTAWRHVIPNVAQFAIVQLSLVAGLAIVAEAALSLLGLTSLSRPSWGRTLGDLQDTVTVHFGAIVLPGIVLVLATLGFNLLGDGLRDALDPRLRTSGDLVQRPAAGTTPAPEVVS